MVLTHNNNETFFTNATYIGMSAGARTALIAEGIQSAPDLEEFTEATIKALAKDLRSRTPPIQISARAEQRLIQASELVRFYETVGRIITLSNLNYLTIKNFTQQWTALMEKKEEKPKTPALIKDTGILRWTEAFETFLRSYIGVRGIPLIYVIRHNVAPQMPPPALETNRPHTVKNGSVRKDLVEFSSHNHPHYTEDASQLYDILEEVLRNTGYSATMSPFKPDKDGRGAYLAIKAQYASKDKWDNDITNCEAIMMQRKWKGQGHFPLEKFVAQHRSAFNAMQNAAEHVAYQLPNELTRVKYLLQGIECSDLDLKAAIAIVKADDQPGGMKSNFEATAAYIIPNDPVAKRRTTGKRPSAEISAMDIDSQSPIKKRHVGETGVEFRYHTRKEYLKLSDEQKGELKSWRNSPANQHLKDSNRGKADRRRKQRSASAASAIAKAMKKERAKFAEQKKENEELSRYMISFMQGHQQSQGKAITIAATGAPAGSALELPIPKSLRCILKGKTPAIGSVETVMPEKPTSQPPPAPTSNSIAEVINVDRNHKAVKRAEVVARINQLARNKNELDRQLDRKRKKDRLMANKISGNLKPVTASALSAEIKALSLQEMKKKPKLSEREKAFLKEKALLRKQKTEAAKSKAATQTIEFGNDPKGKRE